MVLARRCLVKEEQLYMQANKLDKIGDAQGGRRRGEEEWGWEQSAGGAGVDGGEGAGGAECCWGSE